MRPTLLLVPLALLVCVSLGSADLVDGRKFEPKEQILPMTARSTIAAFKADEAAQALVSGNGQACLGLYVFDANGNCVALDDQTAPQSCDDLGVEWIPNAASRYSVVVRNAGLEMNPYRLAIR
jgi:hypothetical protein